MELSDGFKKTKEKVVLFTGVFLDANGQLEDRKGFLVEMGGGEPSSFFEIGS